MCTQRAVNPPVCSSASATPAVAVAACEERMPVPSSNRPHTPTTWTQHIPSSSHTTYICFFEEFTYMAKATSVVKPSYFTSTRTLSLSLLLSKSQAHTSPSSRLQHQEMFTFELMIALSLSLSIVRREEKNYVCVIARVFESAIVPPQPTEHWHVRYVCSWMREREREA